MQMVKPSDSVPRRISVAGKLVDGDVEECKMSDRSTMMCLAEEEADQDGGIGGRSSTCGSTTSVEDVESPKSVVAAASASVGERWRLRKSGECVHFQVLRLKEEESHLGEDFVDGAFSANYKKLLASSGDSAGDHRKTRSVDDVVFYSKTTILPASPLGGNKTPLRGVH